MARRRKAKGKRTGWTIDSGRPLLPKHLGRALGFGLLMATTSGWAQPPTEEDLILPPVDVRGQRRLGEYRILNSDLFKVPSELADYPQSVTIVPQELMREQADFTLREALRNAMLRFEVLTDGSVGAVKVQKSAGHSDFDQAAIDAVKTWRFEPARRDKEPVAVWVTLPVRFELRSAQ
jgi:TonB family protein